MAAKLKVITLVLILLFAGFFTLNKSLQAQGEKGNGAGDSYRLEQLLEAQKDILRQLAVIKEQLNAIQLHTNKL